MLGKCMFLELAVIIGFIVLLLQILFFAVTILLHVMFLAPKLGKKMMHRDTCCSS